MISNLRKLVEEMLSRVNVPCQHHPDITPMQDRPWIEIHCSDCNFHVAIPIEQIEQYEALFHD